jgi:hypothetical protein
MIIHGMRRTVCIAIVILFPITVISGIAESHIHPGKSGVHTFFAILFILSTLAHVAISRKSLIKHFTGPVRKGT